MLGAVAALRMSLLSGPFVPALMVPRTEQGVRLLPSMGAEDVALLRRHIRATWVIAPGFVTGLAVRPEAKAVVEDALKGLTEEELARFRRLH